MPIYDYLCCDCGTIKEVVHSIKEDPEVLCKECDEQMVRSISRVGVQFKGKGWARDNYS